ncbi:hypothetical protein FB567DRAFT_455174 [Paraphoma chrysanthemicola]|uniref:Rhodopsin domain-containing protein n=1 Tax=Paraphoma chrysanthemicola TaxID=798071 RepID=A0A8K0VSU1_9PLEO|nr:hypothetical protein FB567DRAFT_455174 [Paraphoma chrysanthemicola]
MPGGMLTPLDVRAKWPLPNYQNPELHPIDIPAFACITGPISLFMLLARLWVRLRIQKNAGLDDWLMLAAFVPLMTLTLLMPLTVQKYRFNRHVWDVELYKFPSQRKILLAVYILFAVASGLVKLSVLLFYRRITSRAVSRGCRWAMRIVMASIVAYTISFIFAITFTCRPVEAFWRMVDWRFRFRKGGYQHKCINEGANIVANGIIASVQDLIVVLFPTVLCWNIQVPRRQKVALYGIFALSYCTVVVGAVRTWTTWRLFYQSYDVTWLASEVWLWTLLELHLGSMCANAPALRIFLTEAPRMKQLVNCIRSRLGKPRWNSSITQRSTGTGSTSSTVVVSRKTAWDKFPFWSKSNHSRNDSGYAQGPHSDHSTDQRGKVMRMNALGGTHTGGSDDESLLDPYLTELTARPCSRVSISRGSTPRPRSEESDIEALPQMNPPEPAHWMGSVYSLTPTPRR